MGLTVTNLRNDNVGNSKMVWGNLAFDSSYPTGGESLTGLMVGLSTIDVMRADAKSGYLFEYNYTTQKLMAYNFAASGASTYDYNYAPGGGDIKGSAITDSENTDAASIPTNGQLVANLAAVATTWTYTETLEIDTPRVVMILIANDTAGSLDLFEGVTTFAVTGVFRGAAQTESITFTSTAGNKALSNSPNYRYKYGVKPFDRITGVVCTNPPADTIKCGVGIGSKLGYPVASATGADADFHKLIKNGVDLAVATIIDHTNQTVNFGTLADGAEVSMTYAVATSPVAAEVPASTNLSTLTGIKFEARGV